MWIYEQETGCLRDPSRLIAGAGYSGYGMHRNISSSQSIRNAGPIPVGYYTIGKPFASKTHGPFCLRLTPKSSNMMYGRSGFLIHGDSKSSPGMASHGCIILPYKTRVLISKSEDNILWVVKYSEWSYF